MTEGVAATIVVALFLLLTTITFFTLTDSWTQQSAAFQGAAQRQGQRLQSVVDVTHVSATDLTCVTYTADLQNPGKTSIADFSEMDVFVQYTDDASVRVVTHLEYSVDWTVSSITPDDRDPNVWNPGETVTISFTLDQPQDRYTYGAIIVTTPQGASTSAYFSCLLYYVFHAETSAIAGTDYYQVKRDTPGDGSATTISSAFSPTQTGRLRPDPNQGRFVYPLAGISRLLAFPWTVTYRVKRDRADYGFVWSTNASDISLATTGSWQDIDLTPYVPVGATGAIVEVVNTGASSTNSGVVRGREDTRDYMSDPAFQQIGAAAHRWQIAKVDSNRRIQGFIENTDIDFKLLGYTYGPDPAYFATPPDITPGTTGAWTTVDVSGQVEADAEGVILFIDSISDQRRDYGVREVGSNFGTTSLELGPYGNTMYLVGLDGSHQFEVYIQSAEVKIYLVGQTRESVVYYTDDIAVDDAEAGSWQQLDADDYNVPAEANGLVFRVENIDPFTSYRLSLRHGDSADDWNGDIGSNTHLQAAVGINDANVWDQFVEQPGLLELLNLDIGVSIAAYTRRLRMDVHADVDVLIRRAAGSVRAVLDTDAANSSNITDTDWQSFTATYNFPGYTVVEETDYLEIDVFAEATSNNWDEDVSIDFRIDDPDVPVEEQTSVQF